MIDRLAASIAVVFLATGAFAQELGEDLLIEPLFDANKIDSSVPGTPDIDLSKQIGVGEGAAGEASIAFRGGYSWGECPDGYILTTFGTCAEVKY